MSAEWSQVATGFAGRAHVGTERHALSPAASQLFSRIHQDMRDEARGVWISAEITVPPEGEAVFTPNYSERVYWNSPSMRTAPEDADPVPTDEDWAAEFRRNPRAPEHMPAWVETYEVDTGEFTLLRQALNRARVPLRAVRLPGEHHPTFEGAVLVREVDRTFSVDVFDYGQLHHLGASDGEREAGMIAWNYLAGSMPSPVGLSPSDVEQRARAAHGPYADLARRIQRAGPGGVVTNLAPGVPYDRWGWIDGLYLFPWATPLEQRSLPPTAASDGAVRIGVIGNHPIPVQAEFTPAWFDQAGGGIRFKLGEPVRDLVRSGALSLIVAA